MRAAPQTKTLSAEYRRILGDLENVESQATALKDAINQLRARRESAGELRRRLQGIAITARLLDPSWEKPIAAVKRRVRPWGDIPFGTLLRVSLKELRASGRPMSATEIADAIAPKIMPDRQLSRTEINHLATSVSKSLEGRQKDLVEIVGAHPKRFKRQNQEDSRPG